MSVDFPDEGFPATIMLRGVGGGLQPFFNFSCKQIAYRCQKQQKLCLQSRQRTNLVGLTGIQIPLLRSFASQARSKPRMALPI